MAAANNNNNNIALPAYVLPPNQENDGVARERGIPIDFGVPWDPRTFRLVTTQHGTRDPQFLYCSAYILNFCSVMGNFTEWTDYNMITVGISEIEHETMKIILKNIYQVDLQYKAPYDNETLLKMCKATKALKFHTLYIHFTSEILRTRNLVVACQLELENNFYIEMIHDMKICEIQQALRLLSIEMRTAKVFTAASMQMMMKKIKKDNTPPHTPCTRCGALTHTIDFY